jgi:hypothetical protein
MMMSSECCCFSFTPNLAVHRNPEEPKKMAALITFRDRSSYEDEGHPNDTWGGDPNKTEEFSVMSIFPSTGYPRRKWPNSISHNFRLYMNDQTYWTTTCWRVKNGLSVSSEDWLPLLNMGHRHTSGRFWMCRYHMASNNRMYANSCQNFKVIPAVRQSRGLLQWPFSRET